MRLAEPLSGAAPAGVNSRDSADFLAIDEELAKVGSPTAGEVDWGRVARHAEVVLGTQAKDFAAAAALVRAWLRLRSYEGLREGLALLRALVDAYWEQGFPALDRPRARRAAFSTLASDAATRLREPDGHGGWRILADAVGHPALPACASLAEGLAQELRQRFGDGDHGLSPLLDALRTAVPAPLVAAPSPTLTEAPVASAPAPAAGGPPRDRDEALRRLDELASWFQRAEPHSPVGYLTARAVQIGRKPFQEAMRELLPDHQPAQAALWQVLGLPPPG